MLKSAPVYADIPSMGFLTWVKKKNGITLAEAVKCCIEAKAKANRRQRYIVSLNQYLNQFSRGRESVPLSSVANVGALEKWFSERSEAPTTRAANIGRLSSLFSYAHRRGWISENPCFRLERVTIERDAPKILSVEQVRTLLNFCVEKKPVALAFLVLTLFAGVRPEEVQGVRWEDVGDDFIVISAAASKIRRRRIVRLEPIAIRFLEKARQLKSTLPVSRMTHRRYIHAFRDVLGFPRWMQDCLRHTAASNWLALRQDDAYVAMQLGSSQSMLHRHYKQLVTLADAKQFFSL